MPLGSEEPGWVLPLECVDRAAVHCKPQYVISWPPGLAGGVWRGEARYHARAGCVGTAIGEMAAGQLWASLASVGSMLERKWSCWIGPFIPRRKWPEELYEEGMGA